MAKAAIPGDYECPVCHELFIEPKLLPCTHRICKKCVLSWLATKDEDAGCPLCRVPVLSSCAQETSPDAVVSLVDDLPTDLATVAVVESHSVLSGQHECNICDSRNPATSFCFDCNIKLCKSCIKFHARFPLSSNHSLESITTLTAERVASGRPSFCVTHTKKPAELYCCDHGELICVVCASSAHRTCSDVSSVDDVAKQKREGLTEQARRLRTKEAEFAGKITDVEKDIEDEKAHFNSLRSEVKATCQRVQDAVAKRQQELLVSIEDEERNRLTPRAAAKDFLAKQRASLAIHAKTLEELIAQAPCGALLGMVNKVKDRADHLETLTCPPSSEETSALVSVRFDPEKMAHLERTVASFGCVYDGKEVGLSALLDGACPSPVHVTDSTDANAVCAEADHGSRTLEAASPQLPGKEYSIVIIGKTGSGKSTLGNTLLGRQQFRVVSGMASTTHASQLGQAVTLNGVSLKVLDTPDVDYLHTLEEARREINSWKDLLGSAPDAILFLIRGDIRFTTDVQAIYQQVKELWGTESFCERLVVAFTFGDNLDRPIEEELQTASLEEKALLRDAGNRYIVFSKSGSTTSSAYPDSLRQLHDIIKDMKTGK